METAEIGDGLIDLFGAASVGAIAPGSWQIQTPEYQLLVLLSDDHAWLRMLLPIVPIQQAQPFLEQFLEANFDDTQEVRYAMHQGVIWGVYQHNCSTLVVEDFRDAIARLISLFEVGLDDAFNRLSENRIRQIIQAAKQQNQSLETTLQNLDRFYAEGLLGEIDSSPEAREQVLTAWRYQLERLWNE
jgi:hypothetical protein